MQPHLGLTVGRHTTLILIMASAWMGLSSVSHSQPAPKQINRPAALCQKQYDLQTAAFAQCMGEYQSDLDSRAEKLREDHLEDQCKIILTQTIYPYGPPRLTEEEEKNQREIYKYWEEQGRYLDALKSCVKENWREPTLDEYNAAKNVNLLKRCQSMAEYGWFPEGVDVGGPVGRHCASFLGQGLQCTLGRKFVAQCVTCPTCACSYEASSVVDTLRNRCWPWAGNAAQVMKKPRPDQLRRIVARNVGCEYVYTNLHYCRYDRCMKAGWDEYEQDYDVTKVYQCRADCEKTAEREMAACAFGVVERNLGTRSLAKPGSLRDTQQQKTTSSKTATAGAPQRKNNLDRFELGPTFVSPDSSSSGSRTARSGSAAKSGSGKTGTKLTPSSPSDTVTPTTTTTQPVGGVSVQPKYIPR